jgi:4-amino-4-deoxy-L-arabinose transferase-like glycosyltransferase
MLLISRKVSKNNSQNHSTICLIFILAFALFLRVIYLGTIPNGFYCDEASYAYDAYSILHTLRDQHGVFLPFFVRAIDDYRETLYILFAIPFIKVFGLNEFGARLPAAVIGVATVLVLYYLVRECFNRKIALVAAFLLTISPWHIQFSRIGFRAILIPFCFCLALLLFVKSFRNSKYLPISALGFVLSSYTYASARVFVPLFMLGLVIIFWKHLWQHKQQTMIALCLFAVFFIPLFLFWISPEGMSRANATGLETNPLLIFKYYLSYFSPNFLFIKGDGNSLLNPPKIGELYYFELVTVLWGLISIIKENRRERAILLLWLFLYPFPAAITSPNHALRSIVGIPLFTILSAYGLVKIIELFQGKWRKVCLFFVAMVLVASLAILTKTYFIDYPLYVTRAWQYGMREAIQYAEQSSYQCVVMSNQIYLKKCGSLHIFIPFYTKSSPKEYQKKVISPEQRVELFHGRTDYAIGKYNIASIAKSENIKPSCLYIIEPKELETIKAQKYNWKEIHSVKDRRGIEYLKLIEIVT